MPMKGYLWNIWKLPCSIEKSPTPDGLKKTIQNDPPVEEQGLEKVKSSRISWIKFNEFS